MKTKIIYISGNELFDISDIRAAFEDVRTALSLDQETILFGVPVDNDDAFAGADDPKIMDIKTETVSESVVDDTPQKAQYDSVVTSAQDVEDSDIVQPDEKQKKTTRRTRSKIVPITPIVDTTESVNEVAEDSTENNTPIPILSVLGANTESKDIAIEPDAEPIVITPTETQKTEEHLLDEDIQSDGAISDQETQHVSINDMLAEDTAPVDVHEKTLEELLESMTPLGEDEKVVAPTVIDSVDKKEPEVAPMQQDETDATLELLATEFAAAEDKIVTPSKTDSRGKIGKLKNILPFKKAKRDDSGIMGDLFGWAGVANDEDFTIPGFFANATSKK